MFNPDFTFLTKALDQIGFDCVPYSGRAMYGAKCVAIITDDTAAGIVAALLDEAHMHGTDEEFTRLRYLLPKMVIDNAGRDSWVYYWPTIAWEGAMPEEDD